MKKVRYFVFLFFYLSWCTRVYQFSDDQIAIVTKADMNWHTFFHLTHCCTKLYTCYYSGRHIWISSYKRVDCMPWIDLMVIDYVSKVV